MGRQSVLERCAVPEPHCRRFLFWVSADDERHILSRQGAAQHRSNSLNFADHLLRVVRGHTRPAPARDSSRFRHFLPVAPSFVENC